MKRFKSLLIIFLCYSANVFAQADVQLNFDKPATYFTESMPLGNGRLGAMVFGNPNKERIVLNEISMWSGGLQNPNKKDAYKYLKPIQDLLLQGKNLEAQNLLQEQFICAGKGSGQGQGAHVKFGCYQIFGDLWINWADTISAVTNYKRSLRLDSAIATTQWEKNGIVFKQEVISSATAQAIMIKLTASKKGALNFTTSLSRKEAASVNSKNGLLQLTGTMEGGDGDKGIQFAGVLNAVNTDGKKNIKGDQIEISNATECTLVVTANTNLNWPNVEQRGADPLLKAIATNKSASVLTWKNALASHVKDYQSYFNKCRLWLKDDNANIIKPTTERLAAFQSGNPDPSLIALYFNFGRYLLISSSRPGGMPANLQGLWAEEYQTPWNGDYHIDINLQMNYWLADRTNLSACQQSVFALLQQMAKYGKQTAKDYYNANGWVAHVITNPWGFTAPGEGAQWGSTLTGGAWLATHILEAYNFNPDINFLKKYYPILKGASQFFTSILIKEPKHGWLVTAPSNSPENSYKLPDGTTGNTCMGPTIDMQIGRQLLLGTAKAAGELGIDKKWADSLKEIAAQLAPDQVSNKTGIIQEWLEDYDEEDPQHRHVSPLYGLYPYDEITPWSTPVLAAAAQKTLERRGMAGTGWSRAWKINFWARLGNGDNAYIMLKALLQPAVISNNEIDYQVGSGTFPNLFDAHPPFQIDGNFGATAGISEFFVQSQGNENIIRLLPALPADASFANGKIKGIKARNGFEINMEWKDGKVNQLSVTSLFGKTCKIIGIDCKQIKSNTGQQIVFKNVDGAIVFETKKGETYNFE